MFIYILFILYIYMDKKFGPSQTKFLATPLVREQKRMFFTIYSTLRLNRHDAAFMLVDGKFLCRYFTEHFEQIFNESVAQKDELLLLFHILSCLTSELTNIFKMWSCDLKRRHKSCQILCRVDL